MSEDNCLVIRALILANLPKLKRGSLRIWGNWFGKPYDNIHRIVDCQKIDASVLLRFDAGETLQIWNPGKYVIIEKQFEIEIADRVRFDWYSYGCPLTPENHFFLDYRKGDQKVRLTTNRPYDPMPVIDESASAVELI